MTPADSSSHSGFSSTSIHVLLDNRSVEQHFDSGWGLSLLVEHAEQRWLFDVGWDGEQVLANAKRMGLSLEIDGVFISHQHWDHMGGLPTILRKLTVPKVVVPTGLSKRLIAEIGKRSDVVIVDRPCRIASSPANDAAIHSTGALANDDQTLFEHAAVLTNGGACTVITGCAHPGLGSILNRAREHGHLGALVGGFHDFKELEKLAGINVICPCHCTVRHEQIASTYKNAVVNGGSGTSLRL
jgi:7,8-dihydropterin-6-yl-methyl-4-(beta-D-ribofuranosyl)aminobenzene 5'-phosphate synthase